MSEPAQGRGEGEPRLAWVADTALLIEFGDTIDEALNARVLALAARLAAARLPGLLDIVPTYRSLLVHLDPDRVERAGLQAFIDGLLRQDGDVQAPPGRLWVVPVAYGGEHGEDLDDLAAHHGLAAGEIVRRHASAVYRVYMIGFQPGFAYLGGLDQAIARSRRPDPRPRVPAGSIMIGGTQAAIASVATPSGWHLLGRTPVRLFMPKRDPIVLLEAGDRVRFEPIPAADFAALEQRAAAGEPVARLDVSS